MLPLSTVVEQDAEDSGIGFQNLDEDDAWMSHDPEPDPEWLEPPDEDYVQPPIPWFLAFGFDTFTCATFGVVTRVADPTSPTGEKVL